MGFPPDWTGVNQKIKELVQSRNFDVVWIEKGNTIQPKTLIYIKNSLPNTKLISCSEDDMYARHNQSCYYARGLKYYDVVFTTKVYNLTELKSLGAKRTELFLDSYNENFHRPLLLTGKDMEKYGADVGFVGTFEKDRAEKILYLAGHGLKVRVWGDGWTDLKGKNPNLIIEGRAIYGEEYIKTINATKINLGFLRKMNRDEVTSRSVEIPACGGFLLAERTKRHQEFFEEGKEVEFFDGEEELLKKAKMFLADEKERKFIAERGRARCIKSQYSMKDQVSKILTRALAI
jgi:spore maturation protein CgeB